MSVISIIAQVLQYFLVNNFNFRVFGDNQNQDQEEEIILNQDDVDKASSSYLHLRPPPAPSDQALRYGPSFQVFDEPNVEQWATRSAA